MAELGASPVADYSKIGQQGFQISQQASMRAEKEQNELKAAYAATEQQRSAANQAMLMLPPEAAGVMSQHLEKVMTERSKAIMGGSSIATGQSGQEFQELAMTAAKIGQVNKDLVDKYQRIRQSEEYSKNKLAYDTWYNSASETIAVAAESGLEGASQLDFFQPPVLQPDVDIVQKNIPLYQRDFNPNMYQVVKQTGLTVTTTFDEARATENARQFTADQYNAGPGNRTFNDLNYQTSLRLNPDLANDPEALMEIGNQMTTPGGFEDQLSEMGVKTAAEIDALSITASEKRQLKATLKWVSERDNVQEDHVFQLVESVRFNDQRRTSQGSQSGPNIGDFPRSRGEANQINLSTNTLTSAGYKSDQKFGFAGNKNGTAKKFGSGAQSKAFDGIIYDGTGYKAITYVPKQSWINQIIAGTAQPGDIANDMFDPTKYEQTITGLSVIQGAIPSEDLILMKKIAEDEYLDAI
jgi:hypothetical protein